MIILRQKKYGLTGMTNEIAENIKQSAGGNNVFVNSWADHQKAKAERLKRIFS